MNSKLFLIWYCACKILHLHLHIESLIGCTIEKRKAVPGTNKRRTLILFLLSNDLSWMIYKSSILLQVTELFNLKLNKMKAIVENKVKDFSRETADQFVFIINRILKANNETELKSFIQDAKKSDYLINWFFYSGSNHVAVHQAINSKPEKERILFVEF